VLAAMLASTLRAWHAGNDVLTSGLLRMKRNAICAMELSRERAAEGFGAGHAALQIFRTSMCCASLLAAKCYPRSACR